MQKPKPKAPKPTFTEPKEPEETVEGGVVQDIWTIEYEDLEWEEEVGSGAFGTVYKGDYYGTTVAIKRINASENLNSEHMNKYIQREVALLK